MTLAAFELNDSGLRLRTGAGPQHREPGLALAQTYSSGAPPPPGCGGSRRG